MKIVLIGKNGQLGWELQQILPALGEVIPLSRSDLDLSVPDTIQKTVTELKPHLIVNASAYTEVDLAESQIDLAMNVNALAPGILAELACKTGAVFIHYSTDYVFDGKLERPYTESDPVNPVNMYGKSKHQGEENIKQAGDAYLIFRTSWVYSLRGNSFVNKVLGWSRKNTSQNRQRSD
jgi:dTDP-4-dehydrorhamnose reductase